MFFFFQAEDGIRDYKVTGVQTCALPIFSATPLAIAATSFIFDSGTIMRDGALQDWPELLNMCMVPPITAFCRSAPSRVDPVNEIMSISGCSLMAAPTSGPRPLSRLNTPLGTPASCRISAKISAEVGVNSEGFRIMVQPAASAGATLHVIWFSGQFQGVIMPTTPTGSRSTTALPTGSSK